MNKCMTVSTEDVNFLITELSQMTFLSSVLSGFVGGLVIVAFLQFVFVVRTQREKTPEEGAEPSAGGVADGPRHDKP
jgi:hypothetical protein